MNLYHNFCTLVLICLIVSYYVNNKSENISASQITSNQTNNTVQLQSNSKAIPSLEQTYVQQIAAAAEGHNSEDDTTSNDDTIDPLEIFRVHEDDIILGDKNSNIKIFEYFSYTCYHCSQFHATYFQKIKEKYIDTNKIAYIKREFVTNKLDFYGTILSRCAGPLMWKKLNDILLQQQDKWIYDNKSYADKLTNIGQICGISSEQFNTCLEDEKLSQVIFKNNNLIKKYKYFSGTPCVIAVINDKEVIYISNLKDISSIIEKSIDNKLSHLN